MADQDGQLEREELTVFFSWLSMQDSHTGRIVFQVLDTALEYQGQLRRARTLDIFDGIEDLYVSDRETLRAVASYFAGTSLFSSPGKLAEELKVLEYLRPHRIVPLPTLPLKNLPTLEELRRRYDQRDDSKHQGMIESFEHAEKLNDEEAAKSEERKRVVDELPKSNRGWQILEKQLYDAIVDLTEALKQNKPGSGAIKELMDMDTLRLSSNNKPPCIDPKYDTFEERFVAIKKALRVSKRLATGLKNDPLAKMWLVVAPKRVLLNFMKQYEKDQNEKNQNEKDQNEKDQNERDKNEKDQNEKPKELNNTQRKATQLEVTQAVGICKDAGKGSGTAEASNAEDEAEDEASGERSPELSGSGGVQTNGLVFRGFKDMRVSGQGVSVPV
ncbi:hypothetical protein GE09DRAFT_1278025 [Coniochaeta sp. 2T2.1]|nr:hypothetical protein GE09DRAFT_1278025 [Coniochaeta sp. 2T2.1]